jgi:hypothetical protein
MVYILSTPILVVVSIAAWVGMITSMMAITA